MVPTTVLQMSMVMDTTEMPWRGGLELLEEKMGGRRRRRHVRKTHRRRHGKRHAKKSRKNRKH